MRNLVVALSLIALAGCKTDKQPPPATGSGSGSNATGSGSGATGNGSGATGSGWEPTGSAGSNDTAVKPANLTLPKGDGTPPRVTTAALDKTKFEALGKLDVPGFDKSVRNTEGPFDVRFTTPRPKLATTVTIAPCFDCTPIELDKWKAKEASLKSLLAEGLRDRPDTTWEIGQADVFGTPVIFTYQFAHHFGKDEMGQPMGGFSNAYVLYWNDGKNQIRVVSEYKDDPASIEDMRAIAPREDLEKLARAFFDFYTHNW